MNDTTTTVTPNPYPWEMKRRIIRINKWYAYKVIECTSTTLTVEQLRWWNPRLWWLRAKWLLDDILSNEKLQTACVYALLPVLAIFLWAILELVNLIKGAM